MNKLDCITSLEGKILYMFYILKNNNEISDEVHGDFKGKKIQNYINIIIKIFLSRNLIVSSTSL
jgi:hypothetical protein